MANTYIGSTKYVSSTARLKRDFGYNGDIAYVIDDLSGKVLSTWTKRNGRWVEADVGGGGSSSDIDKIKEDIVQLTGNITAAQEEILNLSQNLSGLDEKIEKKVTFDTKFNFPTIGDPGILYVDKAANRIYRWDEDDRAYVKLGAEADDADWHNIEIISGGGA